MKLPRDLSGEQLAYAMSRLGYQVTPQIGSHLRLTTTDPSEHHITIRKYNPLRVDALAAVLEDVAEFHGISRNELLDRLFD